MRAALHAVTSGVHPRAGKGSSNLLMLAVAVFAAVLVAHVTGGHSGARAGCPAQPRTMAAMRDCYRPLLLFAPNMEDAQFREQMSLLVEKDMRERFVLPTSVLADAGERANVLSAEEEASLRKQFRVAPGAFKVVLIGEDGGPKLESGQPLSMQKLNGTIDEMPMRRREKADPGKN